MTRRLNLLPHKNIKKYCAVEKTFGKNRHVHPHLRSVYSKKRGELDLRILRHQGGFGMVFDIKN